MKKLLLLVVFLFVLVGVAVVAVPHFVTPEMIKAQLTQRVQDATGRKLTIDGELSLKVFPNIAVQMEKVTLSNPEGFDDKPFLSVGALHVDVALMPLLHKDVQISGLTLKEPVIRLMVNKAGKQNWDFSNGAAAKEATATPTATASSEGNFAPANLTLGDIDIENAALYYTDQKAGTSQTLEKVNSTIKLPNMSAPLDVKASATWQGKEVKLDAHVSSLAALTKGKADFTANVSSDVIDADAKGTLEDGDKIAAKAAVKSASLKALAKWLNPKGEAIGTPATLALDANSDVACDNKECTLSNMSVALDALKLTGSAKANLAGAKPALSLDVKTGELDFNPFMAADKQASLQWLVADAEAASGHWSTAPIDLSGLKAVDLTANVETAGIVFRQFKIGATTLKAVLKDGALTANVPSAALYDGTGSITLTANGGAVPASFGLAATLKGISLEPLLKDAADMDRLSGKADIKFDSNARGKSQAEIISSLSGNGNFSVADGKISRVNLLDLIHNITGAGNTGGTTEFTQMGGSFTIANGVLSNNDLLIAMNGARVNGQGTVNLPEYSINYRLAPQTYSTKQDATTGKSVTREGVQVPVLITGSLDAPSFQPDVKSVIQQAITDPKALKEQLKNSRGDLKGQLQQPKDVINGLKGLFKKK